MDIPEQDRASLLRRLIIFFAGIYFIQGLSQGGLSGLFYLPISFMLRDHLGFDQSQLAYFRGLVLIPWAVKPLYGLLSDFVPIFGYRRKSWFIVAASVGISCSVYLALFCDYTANQLLMFMVGQALSFAFCDVLCDAIMVEWGKPLNLVDKFQGVQWASISSAAVPAGLCAGLIAVYLSYQQMFFLMAIPSAAVLILALFLVPEKRYQYKEIKKSGTASIVNLAEAVAVIVFVGLFAFLLLVLNSIIWQIDKIELLLLLAPFLILGSLCFLFRKILNGMTYFCIIFLFWWDFSIWLNVAPFFYYQTYTLGFSKMFMGTLQTIGSIGGVIGALLFLALSRRKIFWKERFIVETSLASMLKWAGFIGVVVILTNFLLMGVKSAIVLTIGTVFIYQFARLTMLVLAAEFCPKQIEGTFFALLMSVCNLGSSMSERASGFLFGIFKDLAPRNFSDNFWAKFLVWLGWPTEHVDAKAPYDIFVQYYTIGWLIVICLGAFLAYFFFIRYFGENIKEKKELEILDISQSVSKIKKFFAKKG